ncbi:replication protein [Escherichia coli]|nr:replication protein [Escherichia coli]EGO8399574.1 replication protein [Shigella flexneri]MJD56803.1 replication protein [Escherichia coli]OKW70886.1 replication protein [Escherichia coli]RRM67131.1 replication protein [Escherichia coli]
MHLPPQAAGPNRSHFSYNTQTQPPEKPLSCAELKPQSPSLITEKRRRPGPKGRNRVAFNYECCNYTPSWLLVFWLEVLNTRS